MSDITEEEIKVIGEKVYPHENKSVSSFDYYMNNSARRSFSPLTNKSHAWKLMQWLRAELVLSAVLFEESVVIIYYAAESPEALCRACLEFIKEYHNE